VADAQGRSVAKPGNIQLQLQASQTLVDLPGYSLIPGKSAKVLFHPSKFYFTQVLFHPLKFFIHPSFISLRFSIRSSNNILLLPSHGYVPGQAPSNANTKYTENCLARHG
jgi:hypothetical protein